MTARWEAFDIEMGSGSEIDPDLRTDIEKQGAFASPGILRVSVDPRGTVRYELAEGANADDVRDKLGRHIALMRTSFRKLPRKVLRTHVRKDDGPLGNRVFEGLVERGWVMPEGHGQVALRGPALRLLHAIDEDCRDVGKRTFGAREEAYPALIPTKTLARCGYFESFPQNASLVTHVTEDIDVILEFRKANEGTAHLNVPSTSIFARPEATLSPAVCYHAYRALEGRRLSKPVEAITAFGKCFRYEGSNMGGLDRLWDFSMREIIFVGSEDEVSKRRERGYDLAVEQLERWDLDATIETANDPFFAAGYAAKKYYQMRGDLKFELRVAVENSPEGNERTLACASFNLHEDFFGRTFGITAADGLPAFTGCLAWGLERWVLACFTQHGFDPDRWPADVRDRIFGDT